MLMKNIRYEGAGRQDTYLLLGAVYLRDNLQIALKEFLWT